MVKPEKGCSGIPALALLSVLLFVLLMISSTVKPYGYFIDELYFIACSKRLAFGYVDQPPLSIALLAGVRWLFGPSMLATRFLPAAGIAGTVFLTGLIAHRLGGKMPAILIAGLAVAVMPVFLLFGTFYSMNAFEPIICTAVVYYIVRLVQDNKPELWLYVGILAGLGLEMKHTFILYLLAFLTGFLFTGQSRLLWNRWMMWGALAGLAIILPNILWQALHHFPSLELYRNSFTGKNIERSAFGVFTDQVLFANPATFPLWVTGVIALLFPGGKPYRMFLVAFIILLSVLIIGKSSRPDRIASIYPFLIAFGAVAMEKGLRYPWKRIIQAATGVVIIAGGVILSPFFCPVLPPAELRNYNARLGLRFDIESGKKDEPIPQWLADRIGWRELAAEVALVHNQLPEPERRNVVIVSTNYGPAGALDLYAVEFGLPAVFATHNSFHTWGPPSDTVMTCIGVYVNIDDITPMFDSVEIASVFNCPDCTRPQKHIPIYVLRGPKFSMQKEWSGFRFYQ